MTAAQYDRVPHIVNADYEFARRPFARTDLENEARALRLDFDVDHKEIGLRYIVTAFIFLIAGGIEALILRLQLSRPTRRC